MTCVNIHRSDDTSDDIDPLPEQRGGTGRAAVCNGLLFVVGGETSVEANSTLGIDESKTYVRVDIYDPVANLWTRGPDLPKGMHGHYPVTHYDPATRQSRIYIAGGGVKAQKSKSDLFISLRC